MSDADGRPPGAGEGGGEAGELGEPGDLGEPLEVLARYGESAAPEFEGRLRGRIHRGILGRHVVEATWMAPAEAALEWVSVLLGLFKLAQPHKGAQRDE